MAKTDVPETVVCPNCNHNVVIQLYQVDISINSSQGHFHTVYHRREPAYTVYCINCGHFITNDPTGKPPKPAKPAAAQDAGKPKAAKTAPAKRAARPPAKQDAARSSAKKKTRGK